MFGANAFGWAYFGQAYAGATSGSFVDAAALRVRVGQPTAGWLTDKPRSGWDAGEPS